MRSTKNIDSDWRFSAEDDPAAIAPGFDDGAWRVLDLPHDWSIEGTPHPDNPCGAGGGFFPGGVGWYRKVMQVPVDLQNRRFLVQFDGVYMNSEVWCNGHPLGLRPYGYSSFAYDITPYLVAGEPAVLTVRADNSRQKNCRWYSGSGIYRHVWLTVTNPIRVAHWGTYVTTPEVRDDSAEVTCRVEIANALPEAADLEVRASVIDRERRVVASVAKRVSVPAEGTATEDMSSLSCREPCLWSPDTPYLYTMRIEIYGSGQLLDTYDTSFGIRSIRFDADEGFFLNDAPLKLKGVNEHHDAGCLGAAVPDDVIRRRFLILKEMGCNAIRVAHNPASPAFLDLCDEMGFLVVEDAFDEWKKGKTPYGYGLYWDDWWERDLVDMIHRDRNHPCIVLWSVGNEIIEVRSGDPAGLPIMRALRDVCHREDPTRPMTCGCCCSRETLQAGYGELMDVFGYNGGGGGCFDYAKDHAEYPGMSMFASEVPHSLQTRGVYHTQTWYRDLARKKDNVHRYLPRSHGRQLLSDAGQPTFEEPPKGALEMIEVPDLCSEELFKDFDEHYQSSYDNALVRISSIDSWRLSRDLPFMCGEFRWTGFDYLGECYGWPCKSWNFGVIDLCGFPKDTYYFYQSQWRSEPMVHILPHWTWSGLEGKTIPVVAYSNCERVELFLNDESLGIKDWDDDAMLLRWDVPYRAGTLKAVGYKGDEQVAACEHQTAGEPAALELSFEEGDLRSDRDAVAHVKVSVVDAKGCMVPFASHDVTIEVDGPARLIGLENGDPLDKTNYKLNHRRVFHGMLLAILNAEGDQGAVTVRASSSELESDGITFELV